MTTISNFCNQRDIIIKAVNHFSKSTETPTINPSRIAKKKCENVKIEVDELCISYPYHR